MTAPPRPPAPPAQEKMLDTPRAAAARDRLAAALRENLKRRKAQARARDAAPPPADENPSS
jgi:hypothetical protein